MTGSRSSFAAALVFILVIASQAAAQQTAAQEEFVPQVGQAGKDVVWVPTPAELVETMMDLAKVTPQDYVIDLGSGDGRNVIAAAKRGARALGVEYNPDMVQLSKKSASTAGVGDRAQFVEGDMYAADISKATVMALFLLPSNMQVLKPKFLELRPGSRIVSNTFGIEGWTPDETVTIEKGCSAWCTALLWIVPAKVDGKPIADGKLRGEQIRFMVGAAEYTGKVVGNRIEGSMRSGGPVMQWTATRN